MRLEFVNTESIKPYKKIRKYDKSVNLLNYSIQDFGFINPILVTENYEIICGNGRLGAALRCGLKQIPCVIIDELTEDQIKAYRLIDNQVTEFSLWDYDEKKKEIENIKMNLIKYGLPEEYLTNVNIDDFFKKDWEQGSIFDEVDYEDMFSCPIE